MDNSQEKRAYSFPARKEFLSKKECLRESRRILAEGLIRKMSQKQIAKEIYFHAVAYYAALFLERIHIRINYIKSHAKTVDLTDGGDTLFRRFCYYILWLFPSFK